MTLRMTRRQYADLYGPTVGDRVRLADTELLIEVERDLTGPTRVRRRKRGSGAVLIDLLEAAVGGRTGRKPVRGAERPQVRLRVRVIKRVDDGDRVASEAPEDRDVGLRDPVNLDRVGLNSG